MVGGAIGTLVYTLVVCEGIGDYYFVCEYMLWDIWMVPTLRFVNQDTRHLLSVDQFGTLAAEWDSKIPSGFIWFFTFFHLSCLTEASGSNSSRL